MLSEEELQLAMPEILQSVEVESRGNQYPVGRQEDIPSTISSCSVSLDIPIGWIVVSKVGNS